MSRAAPATRATRATVAMLGALVLVAFGCARATPAARPDQPAAAKITSKPGRPPSGRVQEGMASYYHNKFTGRRTANGERYDPGKMTAAHLTLPFGTIVRVTRINAAGEPVASPVVVRVNDRGPYARGRIIDLSLVAARQLDMLRAGVVRVRVEILSRR